jgi:hypothetical protein
MMFKWKKSMKNYLIKITLNIAFIFITFSCSAQDNTDIKVGNYDNGQLEIFINKESLCGYINIDEEINCRLFFWGKLKDKNKSISIYNPIDGTINDGNLTKLNKSITIKTKVMLLPCQRIIDLKRGWTFDYTGKSKWEKCNFNFIKQEKSLLYTNPNQMTKKKSYLVKNDIVLVFQEKEGWVKVKYINNEKSFFWIKKNDLFNPSPTKNE